MKCCVQVRESGHFDISPSGWGLIPRSNHTTCTGHWRGNCFSTEAMRGIFFVSQENYNIGVGGRGGYV